MSINLIAYILENSKSRGNARLVLIALANYANQDDYCFPSVSGTDKSIASIANVSERVAREYIHAFEKIGVLKVHERYKQDGGQTSNGYTVVRSAIGNDDVSDVVKECKSPSRKKEKGYPAGDTPPLSPVGDTPPLPRGRHEPSSEPSINLLSTKTVESQTGVSQKQKRQQTSIDGETETEPEVGSSPPPKSALPPPPTEPVEKVTVTRVQVEDLLIEFCSETGIPMPEWEQKGKGAENQKRWLTPLRSLLKLCKADDKMASQLVKEAVKKMRADNLTISAPQSIENVAIAIYGVKYGAKKRRAIGW